MSTVFKKILFFADGAKGETSALKRAYQIASEYNARLFVMDVVAELGSDDVKLKPSIARLQNTLIKERGNDLDKLIASVRSVGQKPVIKKMVVPGKDYVEVVGTVIRDKFDLVVKSANNKSGLATMLLGNTDLKILHYCPCPVLILKPSRRTRVRNVLAAVDPVADNLAALQLNGAILEAAVSFAEREEADLHVLHVLDKKLGSHPNLRVHKDELEELAKALKEDSIRKMQRLLDDYAHVTLNDYVKSGNPETVIQKFIDEQQIDLLVMGSVARSGIPGLVVGNTAESLLGSVDCSVMTLKPKKWKSPLKGN